MNISKLDKDSVVNSQKVLCDKDMGYVPNLCYCDKSDFKPQKKVLPCTNSGTATQPRPGQTTDVDALCLGDVNAGIQTNFRYYAYQVMSPADAAIDIVQRTGQAITQGFGPFIQALIHAAIIIGIIIAVLLVLFIIYKFVSNKKQSYSVYLYCVNNGVDLCWL